MRGKTWRFGAVMLKVMCTAPNPNSQSPTSPPPMPSVARASDSAPPITSPSAAQSLPAQAGAPASAVAAPTAGVAAPAANAAPAAALPAATPAVPAAPATQAGANGLTVPGGVDKSDGQLPQKDDGITGFQTSHFGNADDPNGDTLTKAGKGAFGPLVAGDSLALKDTTAKMLGVRPGDKIELADNAGNKKVGTYIDRVPEKDPKTGKPISGERIDIYDPTGSEKKGVPFNAISARKMTTTSAAQTLYPKG
jgi:hypothetical protein